MKTLLFGVALLLSALTINYQFVSAVNAIAFKMKEVTRNVYWFFLLDAVLWTIFYHLN